MIFEKKFPNEDCPQCGASITVKTTCDPLHDTDTETFFCDGDECFCGHCDFESCIAVDENGEAWVQD